MRIVKGFFSGLLGAILTAALITMGLVITLNLTILNPDFAIAELDKTDAYPFLIEQAKNQIQTEDPAINDVIDEVASELEPWAKEQVEIAIPQAYAYLKGEQELNIVIHLEEVRTCIKDNIEQSVMTLLPPELEGASPSMIQAFLSQMYQEIDDQIPGQLEINEALLGPGATSQVQQVQRIIGYIEIGYKALIGLIILLILLIALIQWWHIKPIARYTGVSFTTAGAVCLAGAIAAPRLIPHFIPSDIPPDIMSILPGIISDLTSPSLTYGIVLLVAGIGLIVIAIKARSPGY